MQQRLHVATSVGDQEDVCDFARGIMQGDVVIEVLKVSGCVGGQKTTKGISDCSVGHEGAGSPQRRIPLLLLGSSSLLQHGLSDSLAGRFFLHRCPHWSWAECRKAFGWDLDRWIYFGGYPGAAPLANRPSAWRQYVADALIETVLARDVLQLQTVAKPALLRHLFALSASFPAQILAYNKMLGHLQDAGWWGRLVENAVGAHRLNHLPAPEWGVTYWRRGNAEVDYVVERGRTVWGLEVKSGRPRPPPGLAAFRLAYPRAHTLIIGSEGIPLEEFLASGPCPQLEGET